MTVWGVNVWVLLAAALFLTLFLAIATLKNLRIIQRENQQAREKYKKYNPFPFVATITIATMLIIASIPIIFTAIFSPAPEVHKIIIIFLLWAGFYVIALALFISGWGEIQLVKRYEKLRMANQK